MYIVYSHQYTHTQFAHTEKNDILDLEVKTNP